MSADTGARFKAETLAASVADALARGVRHYDRGGRRLLTAVEVLEVLRDERGVTLEDPAPAPSPGASAPAASVPRVLGGVKLGEGFGVANLPDHDGDDDRP